MKKKPKMKSDSGLHEIKNKKRVRAVKDKKRHVALKRVKAHRKAKAVASLLLVGVVAVSFAFMGGDPNLNIVSRDFLTVCSELPNDGTTPLDHTALENVAYMNYRLKTQPSWYSHMHSNVSCADNQVVDTFKQFSDGILIQTDTSTDDMGFVQVAQQFCWVLDEVKGGAITDFTDGVVMWRTTSKHQDTWSLGVDIPWDSWNERDYSFNRGPIEYFTYGCAQEGEEEPHKQEEVNGLPGTAFSVYVINEETVLASGDVVENGDGTYSQTLELRVSPTAEEDDSAVCHYKNQMVFKGGLDGLPSFSAVTITYTFDSSWRVRSSFVEEKYAAQKYISVSCVSQNVTEYKYPEDADAYDGLFTNPAYEKYFVNQYDKPEVPKELTPLDCLSEAFGPILTEKTSLKLALDIDGYQLDGFISLDLSSLDITALDFSQIDVRANFQKDVIRFYYIDNEAYLSYGGFNVKLSVKDLLTLLSGENGGSSGLEEGSEGDGFSLDGLLGALVGEDIVLEYYNEGRNARFSTALDLSFLVDGLSISDLDFRFNIGEDKSVTLDYLDAKVELGGITIGVNLSFTDEEVPKLADAEKAQYVEFAPYVESIVKLVKEDVLCVTVSYANAGFEVNGAINLSCRNEFALAGDLLLSYNGAVKKVSVAYLQDAVYLNLDGVCVKADICQLEEFIGKFVDSTDGLGSIADGFDFNLANILEKLLSKDFRAIGISEENERLSVVIKLTQILEIFGVGFDGLDEVSLTIEQEGGVSLKAFGAEIGVLKGSQILFDTEGYAEILPYVNELIDLFTGEAIDVNLNYQTDGLSVSGTVSVLLGNDLKVKGDLSVVYAGEEIPVGVYFADGNLYLNAYGLKLKADTQRLMGLLSDVELRSDDSLLATVLELLQVEAPDVRGAVEKIAAQVFAYSFGDLISVSEADGGLNLVLDGNALMKLLLGTDMKLGEISFTVQNGVLGVHAFGADLLTVTKGETFSAVEDLAGYADITEVALLIPEMLEKGALTLGGEIEFNVDDFTLSLAIVKGAVSWKNGFELYLDTYFGVNGVQQEIILKASTSKLQIVYGDVFLDVAFDELDKLDEAFVKLYHTVDETLDKMIAQGSPMPEIEKFTDLITLLGGMLKAKEAVAGEGRASGFNLGELIKGITIASSESENGICNVTYKGISAELFGGAEGLALKLGYLGNGFTAGAYLEAELSDTDTALPTMPEDVIPLTVDSFVNLLDYVGAAVRTFAQADISIDIWGETKNVESNHTVTSVSGTVLYHRNVGEKAIFTIDLEGKTITVAPDLYADISLQIVSNNGGTSTYVDVLIFDYDGNDELDFFVTLSKFASDSNEYKPLKIYAPAGEIMTVLSSGLMIFGIDVDILSDYLVSDWLNLQTVEQLQAFGSMVTLTMQFDGDTLLQGILAALKEAVGDANAKVLKDTFINAIVAGEEEFKVTLNSASVYEKEGLENLSFSILKESGENATLRGVTLYNVYSGDGKEVTSVEIGINTEKIDEASLRKDIAISGKFGDNYYDGYYDFTGVGTLVKAIANTATHTATEEEIAAGKATAGQQVINTNYYATGTISANLFGSAAVSIQTALSIDLNKDGNGSVVIKLRLNYGGYSIFGYSIIQGKQNQLDLTLDLSNKMVYMERNTDGTVVDRVMPLSVFADDILAQFAFILNFGDDIAKAMVSDSTDSEECTVVDYGEMIGAYLKAYNYDFDKHVWSVTLNGDGLTGGVIGDIKLSIGAEEEEENGNALALNTIGASMKLQLDSLVDGFLGSILKVFTITIETGNQPLTIWNASEKGIKDHEEDTVTNLTEEFKEAIGEIFVETDKGFVWKWTDDEGNPTYAEGKLMNVNFALQELDGTQTVIGTQKVLYKAEGTTVMLYATLNYPELPAREGYTPVWGALVGNTITATYLPNFYSVRFVSAQKIGDWTYDASTGMYYYDTQMLFGSSVELYEGDGNLAMEYTVSVEGNVFSLPANGNREWLQADIYEDVARFTSYATPDKITYISAIDFTYNGRSYASGYMKAFEADYTLFEADKISAEYTFLGWYMNTENGWISVENLSYSEGERVEYTVEALWQKTALNVNSVSGKRTGFISYKNTINLDYADSELIGAWANDTTIIKNTVYNLKLTSDINVSKSYTFKENTNPFTISQSGDIMTKVSIEIVNTYTTSDGNVIYTEMASGSGKITI